LCYDLLMVRINITNLEGFYALICCDLIPYYVAIMTNSFLILFIKIKAMIALILQCVYKYFVCHMKKKNLYTSLILSHHHFHIHTSFFISLSRKNILKEVEKKERRKQFYIFSLSLITTHINISNFYLYWKNKHKNIRKGSQKRKKGDFENFLNVRHS